MAELLFSSNIHGSASLGSATPTTASSISPCKNSLQVLEDSDRQTTLDGSIKAAIWCRSSAGHFLKQPKPPINKSEWRRGKDFLGAYGLY